MIALQKRSFSNFQDSNDYLANTSYTYDSAGRVIKITNPDFNFKFGKSGISNSQSSKILIETGKQVNIIKPTPKVSLWSKIKSWFSRK